MHKTAPTGDKFTDSYIVTALWSSNDDSTPQGGEPFDVNYDYTNLAPETLAAMVADCVSFQDNNRELLDRAWSEDYRSSANQGHDFWLTRNGHGAGFWDGDYPETGDALTLASKQFPEVNLYLGDDGKIYQG